MTSYFEGRPSMSEQRVKRDPERTRQQILEVAAEQFAKLGLAGTRVDALATEAGANERMPCYYLGSKEGRYIAAPGAMYAQFDPLDLYVTVAGLGFSTRLTASPQKPPQAGITRSKVIKSRLSRCILRWCFLICTRRRREQTSARRVSNDKEADSAHERFSVPENFFFDQDSDHRRGFCAIPLNGNP